MNDEPATHPPTLHGEITVRRAHGQHFELQATLEVPPGITILFGPSGAGKSTLLAAIAGLVRPQTGHIRLGNETWFDSSRALHLPAQQRRVGYLLQSLALFPHLTVLANVAYGIDRRLPRRQRVAQAHAALERMRVDALAHRWPSSLSGGEAQRVALARVFAMAPRLILLDEPFSALDLTLRRALIDDLRDYARSHALPILHVTHQRDEALTLGERAILMQQGKTVGAGPVGEVLA